MFISNPTALATGKEKRRQDKQFLSFITEQWEGEEKARR